MPLDPRTTPAACRKDWWAKRIEVSDPQSGKTSHVRGPGAKWQPLLTADTEDWRSDPVGYDVDDERELRRSLRLAAGLAGGEHGAAAVRMLDRVAAIYREHERSVMYPTRTDGRPTSRAFPLGQPEWVVLAHLADPDPEWATARQNARDEIVDLVHEAGSRVLCAQVLAEIRELRASSPTSGGLAPASTDVPDVMVGTSAGPKIVVGTAADPESPDDEIPDSPGSEGAGDDWKAAGVLVAAGLGLAVLYFRR